eukprot:GEMP01131713.1.p1 GENE.GEMP01131713.1~~GEMP01131713.1.p1  ORF type:complete len:116 (+),score=5.96 GEMP01131713.1:120-467(+)
MRPHALCTMVALFRARLPLERLRQILESHLCLHHTVVPHLLLQMGLVALERLLAQRILEALAKEARHIRGVPQVGSSRRTPHCIFCLLEKLVTCFLDHLWLPMNGEHGSKKVGRV